VRPLQQIVSLKTLLLHVTVNNAAGAADETPQQKE
jgi:hypothetical protein